MRTLLAFLLLAAPAHAGNFLDLQSMVLHQEIQTTHGDLSETITDEEFRLQQIFIGAEGVATPVGRIGSTSAEASLRDLFGDDFRLRARADGGGGVFQGETYATERIDLAVDYHFDVIREGMTTFGRDRSAGIDFGDWTLNGEALDFDRLYLLPIGSHVITFAGSREGGAGIYYEARLGSYTTYISIPEPASVVLAALAACGVLVILRYRDRPLVAER